MAGENRQGGDVVEPEEHVVQIQKLEAELASERKRCMDKDKQLQIMEALLGRLQGRLELLEENLKEQQRKTRANSSVATGATVLDLQQQLADELAKRKQAQYALIEKGQELCDVQEKLAESQQRIKELLIAKSEAKPEAKKEVNGKRGDDQATPIIISASPTKSLGANSPCASRTSSYAPVMSPCATPKSPAEFKQFFPPKMMVPPLSLPLSKERTELQHRTYRADEHISYSLEIPEKLEGPHVFLECPLPNTCYPGSGYHTPVRFQPVPAPVDYPRILSAKVAQEKPYASRVKSAQSAQSAQSARVISAEHRSVHVPAWGVHSMPLARPVGESPRFST